MPTRRDRARFFCFLTVLGLATFAMQGSFCAGLGDADERALVGAQQLQQVQAAEDADFKAYILAADKRERALIDGQLALVAQIQLRDAAVPGADSRPVVSTAQADAIFVAIDARRTALFAQLDAERNKWLNDPKRAQAARLAEMLRFYADARSEIARLVANVQALTNPPAPESRP